jgi:hypothetical protein
VVWFAGVAVLPPLPNVFPPATVCEAAPAAGAWGVEVVEWGVEVVEWGVVVAAWGVVVVG